MNKNKLFEESKKMKRLAGINENNTVPHKHTHVLEWAHIFPQQGNKKIGLLATVSMKDFIEANIEKYNEDIVALGGSHEDMLKNEIEAVQNIKAHLEMVVNNLNETIKKLNVGINHLESKTQ